MSNLIEIKKVIINNKKIIKTVLFIIFIPFGLTILNLLFNALFNLGIYTGTFLRFLYSIVVY